MKSNFGEKFEVKYEDKYYTQKYMAFGSHVYIMCDKLDNMI